MKKKPLLACLLLSLFFLLSSGSSTCDRGDTGKSCAPAKNIDELLTVFPRANARIRVPLKKKGILETISFEGYKKNTLKMLRGNEKKIADYIRMAERGCIKSSRSNFVVCLFSKKHKFKICDNAFTPSLTDTACYEEKINESEFLDFCNENFAKFQKYFR